MVKTLDGQAAIGGNKAAIEIVKAGGGKLLFGLKRSIKINTATTRTLEKFFVNHTLEDGHNSSISIPVFQLLANLRRFERLGGGPEDFHYLLLQLS